jgi:23S rRNA (uracil1939-C5)-methyltransferase
LWWNGNPERGNAILGPHWQHVSGDRYVRDRSGDAELFYPPGAFGQSHLELAMQLAADAREHAQPGDRVLELYAGVGAIGLGLASRARQLALNEVSPASLEGLRQGVSALPPEQQTRVAVLPGSAESHASQLAEADVAIVDPPRKGLDHGVVQALERTPPAKLVYVSCDIDSLARDSSLISARGMRLAALTVYDLFPHTEHLETLAYFERSRERAFARLGA